MGNKVHMDICKLERFLLEKLCNICSKKVVDEDSPQSLRMECICGCFLFLLFVSVTQHLFAEVFEARSVLHGVPVIHLNSRSC